MDFKKLIASSLGIQLTNHQLNQFELYFETLVEWNQKMNLTAITEKEAVYHKHFYDSLCLIKAYSLNDQNILDVGSGAGFPSIPLKIVYPQLKITIIDALKKRITFLDTLVNKLDLKGVNLIHGRAETFDAKETFDIVTGRAVAKLNVLSELCLPFVKENGYFLAYKGSDVKEEIDQAKNAITILKGNIIKSIQFKVFNEQRAIIVIQKLSKTPKKYPRQFKKIKSNPL